MEFSEEQYQAAIEKIRNGLAELNSKIAQIPEACNAALASANLPDAVRERVVWLVNKMVEILQSVVRRIGELMEGAAAPIFMFRYAYQWQDVRGLANGVAGNLRPEALRVNRYWRGAANDAYNRAVKPQSDAATKIGSIAERTSTSLNVCAAAGLAFYMALGVIVVKFIAAALAVIAALGSVALSWAGLLLIVEEAGVNTGLIIAAVASLTALLGAQASQIAVMHGESIDNSVFPSGRWPESTAGSFGDGSVLGGNAPWQLTNP
jgi:uncharacterized protein YukE